jgi:phosphomannomutase
MAKLTAQEIETTKVIRATFEDSKWVILVSDEANYIYRVEFEGSESDDNATLLTKVHAALLEVDKYEPVVIAEPVVREDLNGLNPGK